MYKRFNDKLPQIIPSRFVKTVLVHSYETSSVKSGTIFTAKKQICLPKLLDFSRNQNVERNCQEIRFLAFSKNGLNKFYLNSTKLNLLREHFKNVLI